MGKAVQSRARVLNDIFEIEHAISNVRSYRKNNASVAHVELGGYMDREDLSSLTWVRLPMWSTHKKKKINELGIARLARQKAHGHGTHFKSKQADPARRLSRHRSWTDNPNASSEGRFLWYYKYGSNQRFASLCSTYSHAKARQDLMPSTPYLRKAKRRRRIEQQCWRTRSVIRKILVCALSLIGKFLKLFRFVSRGL